MALPAVADRPQERFDGLLAHDTVGANKFQPDEQDFYSKSEPRSADSSHRSRRLVSLPSAVGASRRVPAGGDPRVGRDSVQTNGFLTPAQRLERQHLQAAHEARLRFAQERRLPPTNGLYEDFRAVIQADAKDADPPKGTGQELLAAARKAGVSVVLTADQGGPKPDAWRGVHEGVLFIAGSDTDDGASWFPEFGPDGKPIPESGLRFLGHVEEGSTAPTNALAGMVICNGHTGATQDKGRGVSGGGER